MKLLIILAVCIAGTLAVPAPHYVEAPSLITTHAKTYYTPVTYTKYGSQVNHLVQVPAPIYQGVPQPYAVPVPQPYDVPRPVPVAVPRPVPVEVPRPVPVPLVAQAPPLVTKSLVHTAPVHEYVAPAHYGPGPLAHGPGPLTHGPGPLAHGPGPLVHGPAPLVHGGLHGYAGPALAHGYGPEPALAHGLPYGVPHAGPLGPHVGPLGPHAGLLSAPLKGPHY